MRLIDADALLDKVQDYGERQERLMLIDPYFVRKAPTVERPQWIPCSERLPNDDDYKPYLNYTEAVWFCTSDGAIGIGWYYKSTNEWEAFGDIVLRGKVVAWMPIPKPYEVKSNDK